MYSFHDPHMLLPLCNHFMWLLMMKIAIISCDSDVVNEPQTSLMFGSSQLDDDDEGEDLQEDQQEERAEALYPAKLYGDNIY